MYDENSFEATFQNRPHDGHKPKVHNPCLYTENSHFRSVDAWFHVLQDWYSAVSQISNIVMPEKFRNRDFA
jgi:hypothetical protein